MKEGRGSAREDEVCETDINRVLAAVYQRALREVLHLLPQPGADIQSELSSLSTYKSIPLDMTMLYSRLASPGPFSSMN